MTDATTGIWITAEASLAVAIFSGLIALWNGRKTNKNSLDIQELKGAVDRDLERLKAKLSHGQLISSTQWNAEFRAYQALWKSIVPVRMLALKIVNREGELTELGLQPGDVSEELRIENVERVLGQYTTASKACVRTINEYAPFYAAEIRKKANKVHALAQVIFRANMAALVMRKKGQSLPTDAVVIAEAKRQKELDDLVAGTDTLEELIRKRMNEVQVFNAVTA